MATHDRMQRVRNFGAGPGALPVAVLEKAQAEMLNWSRTGMSIMEVSHRSKAFEDMLHKTERDFRALLNVPNNYKVLFMQGGGTGQFAAVPMNLLGKSTHADYLVTGTWSQKAMQEYCTPHLVATSEAEKFTCLPTREKWTHSENPAYFYYCSNETIHGVEFPSVPEINATTPLVCDMSSNILSRPVDVSKYGLIYAGAQKNMGPSGITVVIVRDDLVGHAMKITPTVFDYKITADNKSLFNTPPCHSIYIAGLVYDWVLSQGGVKAMEERAIYKSEKLYDAIDRSHKFVAPVHKSCRSRMTAVFKAKGANGAQMEEAFAQKATERGLEQVKGHRSVGGLRVALFNATPTEAADELVSFIQEFDQQ